MFKKILIANRGEIACRIIRTLKKLNITAIAVYSDADRNAMHVKQADEAYYIGESAANQSYLAIDKIIAAAKASGAEAIHPGYGFLAENPEFAKACAKANIVFIGPPVSAIEQMGSKAEAKALMAKHGVPTLAGYHDKDQTSAVLLAAAKKIGFPILIKASYGGGGRGMRIVNQESEFAENLATAKREALNSFGNDEVILEKYLAKPRHVEVQVFADQQQNYVYLFERDCSIQRRHQKVVEEAPAPGISNELRKKLGEAAIQAAKLINYVGAGTIEFLLDGEQFYFMEMNTRLQVEHPVTEMIVAEDLVEWQIQVAAGLPLSKTQEQLSIHGAAIEVRLCAEDPQNNFLPATGKINIFDYPQHHSAVRVDTGYCAGDSVSIYYDSLLAKIICHGENRESARSALVNALNATQVIGVKTNRTLLNNILQQTDFCQANFSTNFIASHEQKLLAIPENIPAEILIAIALLDIKNFANNQQDPWQQLTCWRLNNDASNQHKITLRYLTAEKSLSFIDSQSIQLEAGDNISAFHHCHLLEQNDAQIKISCENQTFTMLVWQDQQHYYVHYQNQSYELNKLSRFAEHTLDAANESQLTAPMPGRIIAEKVAIGDTVSAGQTLLIMEAMKMEHSIRAPYAGTIQALHCKVGDIVAENTQLIELCQRD